MNKSNKFFEFVKDNPPPCMPDDKLYWFDDETGEIKQDQNCVGKIVLTSKWEWKIIDRDNGEIVIPNESPYFCVTPEDAKKFRDQVTALKFALLRPDENGLVVIDEEKYSFYKTGVIKQIDTLTVHEDYFSAIIKENRDIEAGSVVIFNTNITYILGEDGKFEECSISFMDKQTKRILEDVFEEDE